MLTYNINSFFKKKLFDYNFLNKNFFYVWIILACFIIVSGVLLIYELGGKIRDFGVYFLNRTEINIIYLEMLVLNL